MKYKDLAAFAKVEEEKAPAAAAQEVKNEEASEKEKTEQK